MSTRTQAARILVADDQRDVREALRLLLKGAGHQVETVASPGAVREALEARDYDALLMDLNYTRDTTSGEEGLELLRAVRGLDAGLPVVVMTAWGTIDVAVEAMRMGARDFIEKPWENTRLLQVIRNQVELARALRAGERLEAENTLLRAGEGDTEFVAASAVMRPVIELARKVAPSDVNVLITGENGTGKGMLASIIHANSARASGPLVTVNMGGLPASVFESEFFGHDKGAFTDARNERVGRFEIADSGTLFLDEIANLPLEQQAKLLRVLESGEFERLGSSRTRSADVRVLSATNADLGAEVADGNFRKDLMFRLNTVEIRLPPLRERVEDLPQIAARCLQRFALKYQREGLALSEAATDALRSYAWPGNVRELNHVVERAVLLARGERIEVGDLHLDSGDAASASAVGLDGMTLEDAERILIRNALERCEGNVNTAARTLGLSRSALYRRIEKFGL